jgi:hypothetical protein
MRRDCFDIIVDILAWNGDPDYNSLEAIIPDLSTFYSNETGDMFDDKITSYLDKATIEDFQRILFLKKKPKIVEKPIYRNPERHQPSQQEIKKKNDDIRAEKLKRIKEDKIAREKLAFSEPENPYKLF